MSKEGGKYQFILLLATVFLKYHPLTAYWFTKIVGGWDGATPSAVIAILGYTNDVFVYNPNWPVGPVGPIAPV